MLAEFPEPSSLAKAAAAGTRAVASTDHAIQVFTAAIVTLTRLAVDPAVARRIASAPATFTFTPPRARQRRTSLALLEALLGRQRAGTWMLTLFPIPAHFAVTPSAVTLAMTRTEVIRVPVVDSPAVSLVTLTGVPVHIPPVSSGVHVMARTFTTHANPSVAADLAIWRCASSLALPGGDVALEFTFISMPTSLAVTVSTVTLAVASTYFFCFIIYAFSIIALTKFTINESISIRIITLTPATVTCTCIRADDILRILAHLVTFFLGQVTLRWVLASIPRPAFITQTLATVTPSVACAGAAVVGLAHPLVALAQGPEVHARLAHVTDADPAVAPAAAVAQSAPWGLPGRPAPALRLGPGQPARGARPASQGWREALGNS